MQSRLCLIPFTKPAVAPVTEDEHLAFDELEDVLEDQELSSAIGWAIQLKSLLVCKEEVRLVKVLLRDSFQGRSAHNWSLLLLCAKQVNFIHVVYFLYHNFHFHIHVVDYGSWI